MDPHVAAPGNPTAQIGLISEDASASAHPDASIREPNGKVLDIIGQA